MRKYAEALKDAAQKRWPRLCRGFIIERRVITKTSTVDVSQMYPKFPNVWPALGRGVRYTHVRVAGE